MENLDSTDIVFIVFVGAMALITIVGVIFGSLTDCKCENNNCITIDGKIYCEVK